MSTLNDTRGDYDFSDVDLSEGATDLGYDARWLTILADEFDCYLYRVPAHSDAPRMWVVSPSNGYCTSPGLSGTEDHWLHAASITEAINKCRAYWRNVYAGRMKGAHRELNESTRRYNRLCVPRSTHQAQP